MTPATTEEIAQLAPPADASLSDLQTWMAQLLRHPRGLEKKGELQTAAALHFEGNDRLSPAEQIEIYRQQFWLRHTSALVEDFPGLTGLLGQAAWEPIVESYLMAQGSSVFALKNLGEHLAEHLRLADDSLFTNTTVPRDALRQMAQLEWAYVRAFDVNNDPRLSPLKLAQIPPEAWEKARFHISSSVTLLHLDYAAADARRALKKSPGELVSLPKDPHYLVVYRRENALWDKRVSRPAYLLLEQFQAGVPLVPACEAVIAQEPQAEAILDEQLTEWFTLWGRLGWIVGVET